MHLPLSCVTRCQVSCTRDDAMLRQVNYMHYGRWCYGSCVAGFCFSVQSPREPHERSGKDGWQETIRMRDKKGFGGKALWNHIIKKKPFWNAEFLWKKKTPRPLVNTNESWCCEWNGNCENAAKRRFFERSLMALLMLQNGAHTPSVSTKWVWDR